MATFVETNLKAARARLGEIESQIGPMLAERDELASFIAWAESQGGAKPARRASRAARSSNGARRGRSSGGPSVGDKIKKFVASNPDATNAEIAKAIGSTPGSVAATKSKLGLKKAAAPAKPKPARKPAAKKRSGTRTRTVAAQRKAEAAAN